MFKRLYKDVIKNIKKLEETEERLNIRKKEYKETEERLNIRKEEYKEIEERLNNRKNELKEAQFKLNRIEQEYSENLIDNNLLLEEIKLNKQEFNKTSYLLKVNKINLNQDSAVLEEFIDFHRKSSKKLLLMEKYININKKENYKKNSTQTNDINDNSNQSEFFKNFSEYIAIQYQVESMIQHVIDNNLNSCYRWLFNEEISLMRTNYYNLTFDNEPFEILFKALSLKINKLTKERFEEYVKFQFLISEYSRMSIKFNLANLKETSGIIFLNKLIDLYDEDIYQRQFVVFISLELYNRSIGWKFENLTELTERLKKYHKNYKVEKLLNIELIDNKNKENNFVFSDLELLNGYEFEEFLLNLFQSLGYGAQLTNTTGDQGVDLFITSDDTKYGVQAKLYTGPVGNTAVQEVLSGKAYYNCDSAIVVTNSKFTKSAIELAKRTNVILWDGKVLKNLIREANTNRSREEKKKITHSIDGNKLLNKKDIQGNNNENQSGSLTIKDSNIKLYNESKQLDKKIELQKELLKRLMNASQFIEEYNSLIDMNKNIHLVNKLSEYYLEKKKLYSKFDNEIERKHS